MIVIVVILSVIAGIVLIAYTVGKLTDRSRKNEFKDWQVGDIVYFYKEGEATILGWTTESLYVRWKGETATSKVEWNWFNYNKSAIWRRNYNEAKEAMGKEPGFKGSLKSTSSTDAMIDGKPIELLSEIECQVYLKQCIESEDYHKAELIRKRMENFR
ncbi:MAG: hypothetical protein ACFFKA_00130 [Candidatus Thorarchaeota archaeon]